MKDSWPRVKRCRCGSEVLLARHERTGKLVILEPMPVLVGVGPCSFCGGRDRVCRVCPECGGTGVRGEPLDAEHVVMRLDGLCRATPKMREPWDSAYRRHVCEGHV